MPTKSARLFDVILTDDDENQTNIGRVEADPAFRLKVVSAVPEHREFLDETLELVNGKNVLHVEAAPPPGAPKFAVYSRQLERTTPDFLPELQAYLQRYYDLTLQPAD